MPERSSDPNVVRFFDTTLRDGEQAPGIALSGAEKIEIAEHLARLGVDIIEAGFPASSQGDFDAVARIADQVKGPDDRRAVPDQPRRRRPRLGGHQGRPAAAACTCSSPPATST